MTSTDSHSSEIINKVKQALSNDTCMSNTTRVAVEALVELASLLLGKLGLDSSNSNKPPSSDSRLLKKKNRTQAYEFILISGRDANTNLADNKFYVCFEDGYIYYQCIDPLGDIVYGTITKNEMPSSLPFPESNNLLQLNTIRKCILKIAQNRVHINPIKHPGGQPGHKGVTLKPVDDPDEIIDLQINKTTLPRGLHYKEENFIVRQVVDIVVSKHVTEFRGQVLVDESGNKYVAEFPKGVNRDVQYGASIKSKGVFASAYQFIPFKRTQEQFAENYQIPLSPGSIANFINEGAELLRTHKFDIIAKTKLIESALANADETGVNINGVNQWLHGFSNEHWSWLEPHAKRGAVAMKDINIIPSFKGILCHDHWKSYFSFNCSHTLCNGHHIRELKWSFEKDNQKWAKEIRSFLLEVRKEVDSKKKQRLSKKRAIERTSEYRDIISKAEKECPPKFDDKGQIKTKQSKSRNLLVRLRDFEDSVLMFMRKTEVPFTNNAGEREIRMSKIKLKISGCFKTLATAKNFFLIRSYLQTCMKHKVSAMNALETLFNNAMPDFVKQAAKDIGITI